jgi:hypothetical protein
VLQPARWDKLGLVIKPDASLWWSRTHAMLPTPEHLEGSIWRIYQAGRNDKNQSHVGWALIDLEQPDTVIERSSEPVLTPGPLGAFDDNGVLPSCVIRDGDETLLYYIGFKPGGTTRMDLYGGLAARTGDDGPFERLNRAPILERCHVNPFINTAPWVVRDGADWRMYYVAGTQWVHPDLPRYNIQIATSEDGRTWRRDGRVAIDFAPGENALARPFVYHDGTRWIMWFASKGSAYRARWAYSDDGLNWSRAEAGPGLEPSEGGPDAQMLEYFIVLPHKGKRVVFYNGDDYGRAGVCAAVER